MDYTAAVIKIMYCIESAKTLEHHKAISKMITTVSNHAGNKDKTLKGALVTLEWYNKDRYVRFNK